MDDSQIIAVSITVLAILCSVLFTNARIEDFRDVILGDLDTHFAKLDARLEARFNSIDLKLDELLQIAVSARADR